MNFFSESFKKKLFEVDNNSFEATAIALFKYQAKNNKIYNKYIAYLGINMDSVNNIYDIPFLPINFFKTRKIITGEPVIEKIFISSGTTEESSSSSSTYAKASVDKSSLPADLPAKGLWQAGASEQAGKQSCCQMIEVKL